MLILAGVSLNAIVGDNGIITNAQQATIKQSCAVLSEYLNEKYVEDFANEMGTDENNAKSKLEKFLEKHPNIFFFNGTYDYVLVDSADSEGNPIFLKLRLIRKVNLVNDIKEQLTGGDANNDATEAYLSFQDVYGVTDNLQVYYCSNGLDSAIGASYLDSDILNGNLVMYSEGSPVSSAIAETLGTASGKDATLSEIRSMRELTVSENSGIRDLKFLFDMPNVRRLTLKNYAGSLEGIGSLRYLTYIYFDNSGGTTNITYTDFRYATGLTELYFYMPTDTEVSKMCTEMANGTYESLQTLGLFGEASFTNNMVNQITVGLSETAGNYRYVKSTLESIEYLDLLNSKTKSSVMILYIQNNKLKSLNGIQGFTGVQKIYLNCNDIEISKKEIQNEDGTTSTQNIYGLSDFISGMNSLTTLYCPFSTIPTEDFNNISNTTIKYLSCAGNDLTSLNVLTNFTELTQIQAKSNLNLTLTESVIQKIASCTTKYMDEKYNTKLSLANIGGEVYLGTDAENSDFELLRGKTQIYYLEIPNNKKITDDKLQDVLGTLTGLTILVADNSNLASLNFIKSGSILRYLSIYDTSITNLTNLSNCNDLGGIRINTSGVNLKSYSKILSDMCARGYHWNAPLRMGYVPLGGIAAPASIINTLNGTSDNINTNFKCFSCYWGSGSGTVDFTYTSLESFEDLWNGFTIKVPSCFKRVKGPEVANCTIDYTNLIDSDLFIAAQVSVSNIDGFNGYRSVYTESSYVAVIVGSNTKFVRLGVRATTEDPKATPYFNINLSNLISKGTNIETLELYSQKGFADISSFISLSLNNLTLKTCSLTDLNIPKSTPASNLSTNLTTLTINGSYLQNLEGLSNLTSLTTLDLRNNRLDNTVNVTIDYTNNTKKEIKTCKYIADYCPSVKTVYLGGNADLTDFEDLIKGGFIETATNSRVFTRP